jgi:hypothetical protein
MRHYLGAAVAALTFVLLSGCASNRYCLGDQDYQRAESRPPIQPVEGLTFPDSASALRIPPPPAKSEPFGREDEHGDGVCLDRPPTLPTPQTPSSG